MSVLREYAARVGSPELSIPDGSSRERFDEMVEPDGTLRASWRPMAATAYDLGVDELRRIDGEISRMLADEGVTYEHPEAGSIPWGLDPMPLVLDAATWGRLEVGIAQRAELLGALLEDLYGPQRMLSERVIPAAAVYAHSGFLRPLRGMGAQQPLLLAGFDLGRDAAGEWRVLTDRVQAPSGLGFAMENRRVISRVLPELYREAGLHRVEPYFAALGAAMMQAAPTGVSDPNIVVLSPGTHSETAYDQAFLANVLGFPLVQGGDLVMHEGAVWMKPSGYPDRTPLERVDVIVRRVDAEWCDPLELRAGSQLGFPGMVEAVRRGTVTVVNGLGAGVLENPGLMPFLPAVCERLLGEQLRLPSVPAWWGGEPEGLAMMLDSLDSGELSVRRIDGRSAELAGRDPGEVRELILAEPQRYVGRLLLPLSQTPAWSAHDTAVAQQVTLRTFTIRDGSTYRPLMGGLATLARVGGPAPVTKDVWVLKANASDPDQGLATLAAYTRVRTTPVLAPRALEDMFWAGRYAERAEDMLRLVITARAYTEQLAYSSASDGGAVLDALGEAVDRLCPHRFFDRTDELRSVLLDTGRPGSAAHSFARLREALEGVRDQLSNDTWRVFATVDRAASGLQRSAHVQAVADAAGRMLTGVLSLQGVTANMIQDAGWHMLELGRFLERGLQLCTLLQAAAATTRGPEADRTVLEAVLLAAESSVTHRRRHRGDVRVVGALELLLADAENPRSVAFALDRIAEHIVALPASTGSSRPERLVEELRTSVGEVDLESLAATQNGRRPELIAFLTETGQGLRRLSDAVLLLQVGSGLEPRALSSLALIEERAEAS